MRPLVEAAMTQRWRPALQVLYFHGSLLGLTDDLGLPVLVSTRGDKAGLEHVTELLKAQTGAGIRRIMRPWLKTLLPKLIAAIQQSDQEGTEGIPFEAMAAALGFQVSGTSEFQSKFFVP